MDPSEMVARYGVWIFVYINTGIGVVLGLIPLSIGLIKKRAKLAGGGFLACVIGGALLGLFLAVPACVYFTWLVVRQPRPVSSDSSNA